MSFPVGAAIAAAYVLEEAEVLGHAPQVYRWRELSARMWATTCERCGREVWVSGPAGGWRSGGSATREFCEMDLTGDAA